MPDATEAQRLACAADRLDELADAAELMGDDPTAIGLRNRAARIRVDAMGHLPPSRSDGQR